MTSGAVDKELDQLERLLGGLGVTTDSLSPLSIILVWR